MDDILDIHLEEQPGEQDTSEKENWLGKLKDDNEPAPTPTPRRSTRVTTTRGQRDSQLTRSKPGLTMPGKSAVSSGGKSAGMQGVSCNIIIQCDQYLHSEIVDRSPQYANT